MSSVHLVIDNWPGRTREVIGAFSSRQDAEEYCEKLRLYYLGRPANQGDEQENRLFEVEEHVVDLLLGVRQRANDGGWEER